MADSRTSPAVVDGYGVVFTQMDDQTDRSGLRDGSRLWNSVNAAYMLKELAEPASMVGSRLGGPVTADHCRPEESHR
jgi:hypothetical protein